MTYIAVIGHGTVGSGVVDVLHCNQDVITRRAKESIRVKYICDLRDFPDLPYSNKFIKDFNIALCDPEIKIVVECIGGLHPAYEFVKSSLEAGKSVVTSNKELVAEKGQELLSIAREQNLNFLFEASVGGCIPIIRPLTQCMAANEFLEIGGILNGTTNFILTKMSVDGMNFDNALRLAQELGYAERDPSADIDGHDTCRKICILASLAFGSHVYPSSISTEGIRSISVEDTLYARSTGGAVKLIGLCHLGKNGKLDMCVAPMFIPGGNQLAGVNYSHNAILAWGNMTGDVMFSGRGAGKLPTASAVVADVIDCVKHFGSRKYLYWEPEQKDALNPVDEQTTAIFMRVSGAVPGILSARVDELFGRCEMLTIDGCNNEVGFITGEDTLAKHRSRIDTLNAEGLNVLSFMRVFPEIKQTF